MTGSVVVNPLPRRYLKVRNRPGLLILAPQKATMTPPPIPSAYATPALRVKYSLTRGDILRWQFYLLCRHRVLILIVLALALFTAWNDVRQPDVAQFPIAVKICYALFIIVFMFGFASGLTMLSMWLTNRFKKYRGFLGEHELEIRPDGLAERTDINESVHRWAGFHKLITTGGYLYIYVTDNNVHIVPRHFFASPQAEKQFCDEIRKHMPGG